MGGDYERHSILWKKETDIVQHVLKIPQVSLLPENTKYIVWGTYGMPGC